METLSLDAAHSLRLRLTATGVLELLNAEKLADLESCGVYLSYRDELVAGDGQDLGYFFIIVRGKFEVSKLPPDNSKKRVLATLTEGKCFGEISFLLNTPASANVFAIGETYCWAIPHASLLDYISRHSGGAALATTIASQLARHVVEGNTQILGASAALSAFFGRQARLTAAKSIDAPQAGDPARMEIPADVFDAFTRETLGLAPTEPITDAQREDISKRIDSNDVDIIPWLENGSAGKPLEVQIKFTPIRTTPPTDSRIINVPQTRARVQPVKVLVHKDSSFLPKASVFLLLLGLLLVVGHFWATDLSVETRHAILKYTGTDDDSTDNLLSDYFFLISRGQTAADLQAGTTVTTRLELPRPSLLVFRLQINGGTVGKSTVKASLYAIPKDTEPDMENLGTPVAQNDLPLNKDQREYTLLSPTLPPGNYLLKLEGADEADALHIHSAVTYSIRY